MKKWFENNYDWILIFVVTVSVLSTICAYWNELSVLSTGLKFCLLMIGLVAIINALTIRDKNVRIGRQQNYIDQYVQKGVGKGHKVSYFSWNEENSDGNEDSVIGTTGDYDEINLSDALAQRLIADWRKKLEATQHITLHID